MKPGGGRRKGKDGELEVVNLAAEHGFPGAKRTAPMQAEHPGDYPDVADVGRLWTEVKRHRRVNVQKHAKEALRERPGYIPVLAHRDNGGQWLATLSLAELLKLEADSLNLRGRLARETPGEGT